MLVIKILIAVLVLSEVIKRILKSKRVQARIKKALGIASPSRIYLDVGHGGCNENQKS